LIYEGAYLNQLYKKINVLLRYQVKREEHRAIREDKAYSFRNVLGSCRATFKRKL